MEDMDTHEVVPMCISEYCTKGCDLCPGGRNFAFGHLPYTYGARRSRRGLPELSQTLKMVPSRPVTRDTVSISAKPPKWQVRGA